MEKLSVTEAVTHVSRFFSAPADVAATIEQVGLDDDARTRVSRLSVGRRRRLDVGTAIVGRPALLFLDEPATGFDPEACRELWSLVKSLRADGTTVLLTTHYLDLDGAAHLAGLDGEAPGLEVSNFLGYCLDLVSRYHTS